MHHSSTLDTIALDEDKGGLPWYKTKRITPLTIDIAGNWPES